MRRALTTAALAAVVVAASMRPTAAQPPAAGPAPPGVLAIEQSRVRERMGEVEQWLLEMARLLEAEQPERADRLRRALELSRQSFIVSRMERIRGLLEDERYGEAAPLEQTVLEDLDRLATSLGAEQWADELARLRAAEERLAALAQKQSEATARTRSLGEAAAAAKGPDFAAAQAQRKLRGEGEALYANLRGGPGADELAAALTSMAAAERALTAGERAGAMKSQEEADLSLRAALEMLRDAIQKLEARRRAEVRLRLQDIMERMRKAQGAIRSETERVDKLVGGGTVPRAVRLALADLAARQGALGGAADEALSLVTGEGTAVALPVALREVKADVASCADLLRSGTTGLTVQTIQRETEDTLKALIEALQGAEPARSALRAEPPQAKKGGAPASALLDMVAELKVLKLMQVSLNRRTARLDEVRGAGGQLPTGLQGELERLSARQGEVTAVLAALRDQVERSGGR